MGRELADDIADDVSELLLDESDFAEAVIHTPFGGVAEPLSALIQEHPPQQATDNAGGVRQVFMADLLIASEADDRVTVGRGTEVSKFDFHGNVWRATGKSLGRGALIVRVERNVVSSTKKGWNGGTP